MKCPFELPVKKVIKRPYANPYVENSEDKEICMCQDETEADYIVQAINCYELFKEVSRYLWEKCEDKDLVNRVVEALGEEA